ncbi:hypothetical protein [Nocardia sp. NPDC052566]|uniref:hypothetical protein n=1 Tax=Nocardia sp. NPDC052566 TaxID=3364330 RepID=UPI0037C57D45
MPTASAHRRELGCPPVAFGCGRAARGGRDAVGDPCSCAAVPGGRADPDARYPRLLDTVLAAALADEAADKRGGLAARAK